MFIFNKMFSDGGPHGLKEIVLVSNTSGDRITMFEWTVSTINTEARWFDVRVSPFSIRRDRAPRTTVDLWNNVKDWDWETVDTGGFSGSRLALVRRCHVCGVHCTV